MFLVCINDLWTNSSLLEFSLIADDTNACVLGYSFNTLVTILNKKKT